MSCLFNPIGCLNEGFWNLLGVVPWWGWAVLALALVGIVWKLAGWPGLLGLGFLAGFILGRRDEPFPTDLPKDDAEPPFRRQKPKVKGRTAKRSLPTDSLSK